MQSVYVSHRAIMNDVNRDNRVLSLVNQTGLKSLLVTALDQLGRCQKSLTEFLEVCVYVCACFPPRLVGQPVLSACLCTSTCGLCVGKCRSTPLTSGAQPKFLPEFFQMYESVCLFTCLCVCQPFSVICPFHSLSACLNACMSVRVYACVCVCVCTCVCIASSLH